MNREPIIIELTPKEIEDIAFSLQFVAIVRYWEKEENERIEKLAEFFNELNEVDLATDTGE